MRECIYRCNQCKVEKKATNHWWVARITVSEPNHADGQDDRNIVVCPWGSDWIDPDGEPEEMETILHLCGRKCVGELMDQWMDSVAEATSTAQTMAAAV